MVSVKVSLEHQHQIVELELLKEKVETQHRINLLLMSITDITDVLRKSIQAEAKRRGY